MATATTNKATRKKATAKKPTTIHPLAHLIPSKEDFLDGYEHRDIRGVYDFDFLDAMYEGDGHFSYNLLVEGPTGGAKTSFVYAWCAARELPLLVISGSKAIDMEQLVGGPGFFDGELRGFVPGDLIKGMQYGCVVLFDERNYIPQKVMGRLNSCLDRRKSIEVKDAEGSGWCANCGLYNDPQVIEKAKSAIILKHLGKRTAAAPAPVCKHCGESYQCSVVTAKPGSFMAIATQNPGYEGVYEDNEAQRNRFDEVVLFDYDNEVERRLLWSPSLLEFAEQVRSRYGTDFRTPLGTNRLMHFEQVALNGTLGIGCACEGLVDYFHPEERPAIKNLLEQHVDRISEELAEV